MKNFTGDLSWIHEREGHNGKPYWPGGMSGVTLDPGIDLGHVDRGIVLDAFASRMTAEQLNEALKLKGVTGKAAQKALSGLVHLQDFRISKEEATSIFHFAVEPYWNGIQKRWPILSCAPPSVQTALLSLAYNRGYNNAKLEVLTEAIHRQDWLGVGEMIGKMQQTHVLSGIRRRRRLESRLILDDSSIHHLKES